VPFPSDSHTETIARRISTLPSPLRLVLIVVLCVFAIEIGLMAAFAELPPMPRLEEDVLDAALLTLLLSPVLYLFIFRPLRHQVELLQDAATALRQQRDHLDQEVKLRTSELEAEKNMVESALDEIDDLYQHAPCGYHSLDADGVIVRINDTELHWLGYSRNELVGIKKWADFLTPESAQVFADKFASCKQHGQARDLEFALRCRDGTIMHVLASATAAYDENSAFVMSRSTLFDITDRQRAQELVRESEARLKEMFENLASAVAVYRASEDGRDFFFTAFNRAAERIEQVPRADVIGRNVVEVFPGITQFGLLDVFRRVWNTGRAEHFPSTLYREGQISSWRDNHVYKLPQGEVVAIYEDVTQRKLAEQQMHRQAYFDTLTGLPNRALLFDRLRQALARARREGLTCALMFLDLDKFKHINDTLGHEMGDAVLMEAARRLRASLRESDTVARLGGDEFVVLLPTVNAAEDAGLVAEKIRASIAHPFELSGHSLHLSASIGIAVYPADGGSEKELVTCADAAMYAAKQGGGNRVAFHRRAALP
jgi:diguanylate cyclase (GGDEF)-like protein/PAS domain S-box-containing protein